MKRKASSDCAGVAAPYRKISEEVDFGGKLLLPYPANPLNSQTLGYEIEKSRETFEATPSFSRNT